MQTLLLAAGIDANGKNVLLAWAIVESENSNSWDYFLHHLKAAIPEVEAARFMSDRSKGLLKAEPTLGPEIVRAYCCKHLKANFIKHAETVCVYNLLFNIPLYVYSLIGLW